VERTATWLEKLEGGVEHLRRVIVDDVLGIVDELDDDGAPRRDLRVQWRATLADPRPAVPNVRERRHPGPASS
jgi:nitrite reductase (NADH) large subunit